jgi:hypothetical protein
LELTGKIISVFKVLAVVWWDFLAVFEAGACLIHVPVAKTSQQDGSRAAAHETRERRRSV